MKRYGIYITVILLFLSGAYYDGSAQNNSSIVSIQMTYPINDTIFDPATDSIIIQVQLNDYFIWENDPPANIGFFSYKNNYSWVNKTVTNTTLFQPTYKCVSPVYDFTDDVNTIYFWLYDEAHGIDTVTSHQIIYNKPHVELVSVVPADIVPGTDHYVVYESNPALSIYGFQSFTSSNQFSLIRSIDMKEAGTSYIKNLWLDEAGEQNITISRELPSEFSLSPGSSRSFVLTAAGRTKVNHTGPPDISEDFAFELTYLYLDVPDTICQVNSNISLSGFPAGGSFEGNGIIDNTDKFNPFLAQANAYNTITYKYIIDGHEFSVSKDIYVIDLPVIGLKGEIEVCANSTDVRYEILNADISKYTYNWAFTGVDEIIESTDISRTVRWEANPASYTGRILISLESKNPNQSCPAVFEYLIDIDPDAAPDKPCICFGDISKRLLLCSNTEAAYYKWYTTEGDSIGFTTAPYFYLTDDIVKYHNIDNSTLFTIRIANQETGCYTTGFMCEENMCVGNQENNLLIPSDNTGEDLSVTIQSNPVRDLFNLKSSGNYKGQFDVLVYSMTGSMVFSSQLTKVMPTENHKVALQSGLNPGVYFISVHYNGSRTSPIKMIVY